MLQASGTPWCRRDQPSQACWYSSAVSWWKGTRAKSWKRRSAARITMAPTASVIRCVPSVRRYRAGAVSCLRPSAYRARAVAAPAARRTHARTRRVAEAAIAAPSGARQREGTGSRAPRGGFQDRTSRASPCASP
ncbi:MAG: hypothetical protein AUG09_04335 [Acidobacteria bacterium 13_1_20CM_2_68_7]|nr:MAG: hypothetical protein AUG09_04335 [Acidobacteria bacterium 13_1_20CM_2_68_7]